MCHVGCAPKCFSLIVHSHPGEVPEKGFLRVNQKLGSTFSWGSDQRLASDRKNQGEQSTCSKQDMLFQPWVWYTTNWLLSAPPPKQKMKRSKQTQKPSNNPEATRRQLFRVTPCWAQGDTTGASRQSLRLKGKRPGKGAGHWRKGGRSMAVQTHVKSASTCL